MTIAVEVGHATKPQLEGRYCAMAVCWILGLGSLLSYLSLLTAQDYYYKLFPRYHPARVLALIYPPFAFGTLAILAYNEAKINTRMRILAGYIIFFMGCLLLLMLDVGTSGKGGIGIYIGICSVSGAFGVADALARGGMVGDLSFTCPEFIQSFLAGVPASGALTSIMRLSTKAAFQNANNGLRKGAVLFLAMAAFFEFLCVILYAFVFPKLPIVNYYRSKAAFEGSKTVLADLAAGGIHTESNQRAEDNLEHQGRLSNIELLSRNKDYAIDLFLTYMMSFLIYPGFLCENTRSKRLGSWYALILITVFNVSDMISRYIPLIEALKMESRKNIFISVLSRFLLIPAFYFTAKYGAPVWMILLTALLGLSMGYFTVCVMTAAPKGYKGPEQNALGNMLTLCLIGGMFAGVTLDWLWLIGKRNF